MKRKIIITDNINKTSKTLEVNLRNMDHLIGCQKYPSQVYKNKKKYTRKVKHKKDYNNEVN